jgi:hypothetical protein
MSIVEPNGLQSLPRGAMGEYIPTANFFITQDASGTPKTSPLTVSSSEVALSVPTNAAELVIVHTSQALRISGITGMARYVVLPIDGGHVLQVASGGTIYLKRDSVDCVVQFYFRTL